MTLRSLLLATAAAAARAGLRASVAADGSYSVQLDGATWFASAVDAFVLRYGGQTRSSAPGKGLTVTSVTPINGVDPVLGTFDGASVSINNGIMVASVKNFAAVNAVMFEQSFPSGLTGTAFPTGTAAASNLSTGFPVLGDPADKVQSDKAYLAYAHCMCDGATGSWTAAGIRRNSGHFGDEGGVLAVFNKSFATVVISSASNFMTTTQGFAESTGTAWAAGFNGMIAEIPAGWTHRTVMVGGQGVNETMYAWGDVLLSLGGKHRTPAVGNFFDKLSYWTDNGAYYYYGVEGANVPGAYQKTMLDVRDYYVNQLQLNVSSFQYDSWWYFKNNVSSSDDLHLDEHTLAAIGGRPEAGRVGTPVKQNMGAVTLWEPTPDVFPSGMGDWLGLPLALHNRYFAVKNNYTDMGFEFLTDPAAKLALPVDKAMFTYIMKKARDNWRLAMYEQDWLNVVWQGIPQQTKANITAANSWLDAMADAASDLGLEIQYCMPLPNHILHSTGSQAVTNARASGDYHPGANNWQIGLSSLFYWAVGIAPSKDDYWTTEVQPGSPYGDNPTEPNWQLQAITIALSGGPNGPSDSIGGANASLIRSTITGDGTNLKPDRPAIVVQGALASAFADQTPPLVTATWSQHGAYRWHYVLAAELSAPYTLTSADLGPAGATTTYAVFDFFAVAAGAVATMPAAGGSFTIARGQGQPSAPSKAQAIRYYLAAPVLPGGWVLVGEAGKIVSASALRVASVAPTADGFTAVVRGYYGETTVAMVVAQLPATTTSTVSCPSGEGVTATLACGASGCSCA